MNKKQLKQIRLDAGLTQAQLAKLFRLSSQNYVSKIESGEYTPDNQTQLLYELLRDKKLEDAKRRLTT